MTVSTKRTVRKGRIYHIRVADITYRAFIWQTGASFCGRVEDEPDIPERRGRSEAAVREQLSAALVASLKA